MGRDLADGGTVIDSMRRRRFAVAAAVSVGIMQLLPTVAADASMSRTTADEALLSGNVFVDFDRDGRPDPGEDRLIPDAMTVEVTIRGTSVDIPIAADGSFAAAIQADIGDQARLVFDVPDGYQSTFVGQLGSTPVAAGPEVQYVTISNRVAPVTFGIVPESSCPVDPAGTGAPSGLAPDGNPNTFAGKVWTTCFVDGARSSRVGAQDVLVGANFDASGWSPAADANNFGGNVDIEHIATKQDLGAVWGVAYDEWDGVLYASAVVKRHADLGPEGIDGIYWFDVDPTATSTTPMSISLDSLSPQNAPSFGADPPSCPTAVGGTSYDYSSFRVGDTARGRTWDCRDLEFAGAPSQSYDWWAYDRTGRGGIGDIDVTPDGEQLLVVNATSDTVFIYDITTGTPVYERHFDVLDPGCANGEFESWALTARDAASAYVGITCTASASGDVVDLVSHVVAIDLANGDQTTVAVVPFDYARGAGWSEQPGPLGGNFQPWLVARDRSAPSLPPVTEAAGVVFSESVGAWVYANGWDYHQPLLSDIEVDPIDESLVLAITDRWAMMTGVFSCDLDPTTAGCAYEFPAPPVGDYDDQLGDDEVAAYDSGIIGYVAGDLLRVCNTGTVGAPQFALEGDGECDPSGFSPEFDGRFGGGPAGSTEWYWNDQAFTTEQTENAHPEAAQGAVFIGDRRGDVVYTAMNPTDTFGAGLTWDANVDGAHRNGLQLFRSDLQNRDGSGFKSAALGDVEGCTIPLEVAAHVWFDADVNGLRDGQESSIAGIGVELLSTSGAVVAVGLTDDDGRVAFGSSDGLLPQTSYSLRVTTNDVTDTDDLDVSRSELRATTADAVDDRFDSDLLGDRVEFTTGLPGENDHTIGVGLGRADDLPDGVSLSAAAVPNIDGADGAVLGESESGSGRALRTASLAFGVLGVLVIVMIFALRWSWNRES